MRKVSLLLACLLIVSFDTFAENINNSRPDQVTDPVRSGTVVFVDHRLSRKKGNQRVVNISVEDSGIVTTANGYKQSWAVFRNHTDHDYVIEVRSQFFDGSNAMTDDMTKWKRVFLPANSTGKYSDFSIDFRTSGYRIEVRSAS